MMLMKASNGCVHTSNKFCGSVVHTKIPLLQAAENCSSFNASPSLGFIVGGCSSGANFTASTVLRARDDPFFSDRPITGQFLQLPSLIHSKAEIPERYVWSLLIHLETHISHLTSFFDVTVTNPYSVQCLRTSMPHCWVRRK